MRCIGRSTGFDALNPLSQAPPQPRYALQSDHRDRARHAGSNHRHASPAQQLASLRKQRDEVASEVEQRVHAHHLWPVLTSMPGVGVRTGQRPPPDSSRKSPTKPPLQLRILPLTPASPPSPDARALPSAANTPPGEETKCSRARYSCRPLLPCEIRSRGTITLARSSRASATIKRSLLLPDGGATCCSPCCVTAPSFNRDPPRTLDESHSPPGCLMTQYRSGSHASPLRPVSII
jgi:hypothetical protein